MIEERREEVGGTERIGRGSMAEKKKENIVIMHYMSIILAGLSVAIPFFYWLKVPIAEGIYSFFGMNSEQTKFSLFEYIFAGSGNQHGAVFVITLIIALIAFLGVIFNIIYIVKALQKKEKIIRYGLLGSRIMLVVSVAFIVIVGLICKILNIMELTAAPYIALVVAAVNNFVIKKMKNI